MNTRMSIYAGITDPITAEAPCGPDPDADPEIMNFLGMAEGQLPASYRSFDKKAFDPKPALEKLQQLLAKSRDLRFLALAAKLNILSDNVPGFTDAVIAMRDLLKAQWEGCHPSEHEGGDALRSAYLATLDDLPTVVLPLQNTPIIVDKRLGPLSMRAIQLANKKIPAQADEAIGDPDTILTAFHRDDRFDDLVAFKSRIEAVKVALKDMHQLFVDKVNHETAPHFQRLPELLDSILAFIGGIVNAREGTADASAQSGNEEPSEPSLAGDGGISPTSAEELVSVKEASNALGSILAYYSANEPSSPAWLMTKQALQLVGKTFVEAMQVLAPGLAQEAKISIGGDAPFTLDFAQLSSLAQDGTNDPGEGESRTFSVTTRAQATALMSSIERFYRRTEPSSPIPLLLERARTFASKDFASLLKEMTKQQDAG
jgi:type VI secretion system protein ImpA